MGNIKVLVTGSDGQLGRTIEELFSKNSLNIDFVFLSKGDLDITNQEQVDIVLGEQKFDYCINCAAYTNVEQAEKKPSVAYAINAEAVKNLADVCEENNIVLIHISTDYVFDGEKIEPYTIKDLPNPINEYGKSKLQGEKYIQNSLETYFIIRTSWLYSKKYGNNFYKTILKKAKVEKELYITTEQIGCPTDTVNLSKFIIKLINSNSKNFGIFHFCDKKSMTWYNFTKQILKENNLSNKVKLAKAKNYHTFARRPKNSILTD
ncbi:MAG: dTDP-4-dehydrorhamnose reductase [Algibacter sp.]